MQHLCHKYILIHQNRQSQSLICMVAAKTFPNLVQILVSSITQKNILLLPTDILLMLHSFLVKLPSFPTL